ncbi:unnamed protein product [Danaus chrysippus]|uniref:(African queen) hypothetical protein n=1 Tax=Danaus chrysippus TaxID=151541 RepID=A0A8J2WBE2_9NEOP|nr:unnamed protein product [Danaus chrysippus]
MIKGGNPIRSARSNRNKRPAARFTSLGPAGRATTPQSLGSFWLAQCSHPSHCLAVQTPAGLFRIHYTSPDCLHTMLSFNSLSQNASVLGIEPL